MIGIIIVNYKTYQETSDYVINELSKINLKKKLAFGEVYFLIYRGNLSFYMVNLVSHAGKYIQLSGLKFSIQN